MTHRQTVKSWQDKITFGKFSGQTFADILEVQPSYILWLDEEAIVDFPQWMIDKACYDDANSSPPEEWYWQPE